jgi:acyl-CoA thioester hydrolase
MAEPSCSQTSIEVRYAETDQMGVVHHANYIVWFELARTHLCAATGIPYAEIERQGHLLMVIGVDVRYRLPARYGETVVVSCRAERATHRTVRFVYEVRRGTALLTTGHTDHIWVDAASGRPCRLPHRLMAAFARLAGQQDPAPSPAAP